MTLIEKMLAKEAEEEQNRSLVHHPLAQALGYGALAAEGIHELAHRAKFGKGLQAAAQSKWGERAGTAAIGGSAAFLGAEGASALKDYFKRRKQPTQPAPAQPEQQMPKLSSIFFDEVLKIAAQAVVVESHPTFTKPWFKELGQSAVKGGAAGGLGAVVAYQATRIMNKLREEELNKEQKHKAKTVASAAKEAKVPMVVKL